MANTLFDKIWDAHIVQKVEDGPTQLYIDRLYCHEVTSPQALIRRLMTRTNLSKTRYLRHR